MIDVPRRKLDWSLDPAAALRRWPGGRALAMLHSGRTHPRWSRWSVLAEPRGWWKSKDGVSAAHGLPESLRQQLRNRPFGDLERLVTHDNALWLGYLGYDLGRRIERIGDSAADDRRWPDAAMLRCPGWLLHDRMKGRWWACGAWAQDREAVPELPELPEGEHAFTASEVEPDVSRAWYLGAVRHALAYIAAGDVFQVNLTQRMGAAFSGSRRGFYAALAEESPAWYGAYLEFPGLHGGGMHGLEGTPALASISPELLFELDTNGRVVTRPIKGTRPASAPLEELETSAKDRAELAMIVDLLRNDLGRVCGYGSINVEEAREIERHPTVQHGVATVSGRLHASRGLADLLRAVLPGGSITGAPKVRAMQVIEELEPSRRGPYCGAIGWLRGRAGAFNVAIRTVQLDQGRAEFGVGGGIVADSDPQAEYEETLTKAAAMIATLRRGGPEAPSTPVVTEGVGVPGAGREFARILP